MADPVTLEQLRTLATVVEEGNFSAAARKLRRVQSAVSTSMANLERELGVPIWDRTTRIATLTSEGAAVLAAAKRVLAEVDALVRLTSGMTMGLEAHVSLCIDSLFPIEALVDLCAEFAKAFPSVDLRLDTQTLTAVSRAVLDRTATLGVASPLGILPGLEREVLAPIRMVPVVSPRHPLAAHKRSVSASALASHVQIVLSERRDDGAPDQAVLSPRTWRVADLSTKHALLRGGLGWGNLPEHLVRDDLAKKRLVAIRPVAWGEDEHLLYLSAVFRSDTTFGPAHRWLLTRIAELCARNAALPKRARR
jgi:DNA-binding transcriptional LysR family regulator